MGNAAPLSTIMDIRPKCLIKCIWLQGVIAALIIVSSFFLNRRDVYVGVYETWQANQ